MAIACLFSRRLRFPICRNAQLTAFFTKLRSSHASRSIAGKNDVNFLSSESLSCTVSSAISTNPARLTYSSLRLLHSAAFLYANGVLSNNVPQHPSQISHEEKSFTQRSICASVTFAGSSTIAASSLASWTSLFQSTNASAWSFLHFFAYFLSAGMPTQYAVVNLIPKRCIPARFFGEGLPSAFNSFSTCSTVMVSHG